MGADITCFAEVRQNDKWVKVTKPVFNPTSDYATSEPFNVRNYAVFGFLADVRNYSNVPPISYPRGLPDDFEWTLGDDKEEIMSWTYHHSWLSLKELLEFDYDQSFADERNYNNLAEPGVPEIKTYRRFLEYGFFDDLLLLKKMSNGRPENVRIVFWFS